MADITDGGYFEKEKYAIELVYNYNGLYSKFIDKIYYRSKYNKNIIDEYGISIRNNYIKYSNYTLYRSLDKEYQIDDIIFLNLDDNIRQLLINLTTDILITEEDLIMCEREVKLNELKKKIKKEKSIVYKIRKIFKRK